jgi:hypothetical protein
MQHWVQMGAAALALSVAACGGDPCNAGKSVFTGQLPAQCTAAASSPPAAEAGLVLRVLGTSAAADIFYSLPAGMANAQNVPLPWSISLPAVAGDPISLRADQASSQTGDITVVVSYNGKVLQQTSGSGSNASARVSVTCCGN